jgi:hypothetical protein
VAARTCFGHVVLRQSVKGEALAAMEESKGR